MSKRNVGYAFVVCDLLHYGHLNFLKQCKQHCDFLIVGVYTDELVASYKRKAIISFEQRIELVKALKLVDMAIKVEDKDATPALQKLTKEGWKINYLFHGDDWKIIEGQEYIESIGGQFISIPYTKDISTTAIINKIEERYAKRAT